MSKGWIFVSLSAVLLTSCACLYAQDYQFTELVQTEAAYILQCQYTSDPASVAFGAINDVQGDPTWVVPRENGMAILGLVMASELLKDSSYKERAQLAADYLVRVQDSDGAWFNQYNFVQPGSGNPDDTESLSKSPTQTAEAMLGLHALGFQAQRYPAIKKGAKYLIACQKNGGNGFLLGGGKAPDGSFRSWRWASDNAYAYQALKAAEVWALMQNDFRFAIRCSDAARKILKGINETLYIKNPYDPDFGVWYRAVDQDNAPVEPLHHDWINYAPQMVNLPCRGVNHPRVGKWIHRILQRENGACVWDDYAFTSRESPGYTFEAVLCWRKLGQAQYYIPALNWALDSGLWQVDPDENAVPGGWIDWQDSANSLKANWWERFIDTSFYAIAAYNGGYDFTVVPAFLRIGYANPKAARDTVPCYLKFKLEFPEDPE